MNSFLLVPTYALFIFLAVFTVLASGDAATLSLFVLKGHLQLARLHRDYGFTLRMGDKSYLLNDAPSSVQSCFVVAVA